MRLDQKKASIIVTLVVVSLLFVFPIQLARAQTATVSVSPSTSTVSVGQTLTVNIKVSNVENLYGVDIALNWDTSILKLDSNQSFVGVSNGVLNSPVLVVQDTASQATGEYNIIATSENPAGPFSGSATIATLTFSATQSGQSNLTLQSSLGSTPELASYPQPGSGQTSELINVDVVNGQVVVSSSTSPIVSPTPHLSTSPSLSPSSTSSPGTLLQLPLLDVLAIIVIVVIVAVIVAVVLSMKKHQN